MAKRAGENDNNRLEFRCLHLWVPHEGRPISSLFFLDDHKNLTQEFVETNGCTSEFRRDFFFLFNRTQLWRYAVSGCDHNRELKVWSCTNWSCLQVIRYVLFRFILQSLFSFSFQYSSIESAFQPPIPILKASIDLTSRFLVLSDIHSTVNRISTSEKSIAFLF